VDGDKGQCKGGVVCPFHGWVYNLDGTLRGAAQPASFGAMNKADFGLKPIELNIFHGFLFIRFAPGPQPQVAELMAPFNADFATYRLAGVLPVAMPGWVTDLPVNWKSVRDVDNEGYHVAMAHPGLQDLYGRTYRDYNLEGGLSFSIGYFGDAPGRLWSVREYVKTSPQQPHLPNKLANAWTYYGLWPNTVFSFTPESVQYYQDIPQSAGLTRTTGRLYQHPGETRQMRAARYLAYRIDRDTSAEDQQLSIWSNESMKSEAFEGFHLSDLEYGVRRHHDQLRAVLPVMTLPEPPAEAEIVTENQKLLARPAAE